jgi:hypothetical protein
MSGVVTTRATNFPDPRLATLFDDFIGYLYDNQTWSTIGTGSIASRSLNGGVVRVRATAGSASYEFLLGNMGVYSVANDFTCEWRASLVPGTGVSAECGMEGAGDQATNWICWQRAPGTSSNFLCQTGSASGNTTTDSGVVADTAYHLFKIIGSSGYIQFLLDDVPIVGITTNITASQLQPYIWCNGSSGASDVFADYVLVSGDRS